MVIAVNWPTRQTRRPQAFGALLSAWLLSQRSARFLRAADTADLPSRALASTPADGSRQSLPAFEAFFRRHEGELFGYLWRMAGDEQTAYDLSQETFVRAWQHFDRIASYERPGAWLFRVATNLALTYQKRATAPVGTAQPFSAGVDPAVSDPAWKFAVSDAIRATLLTLTPQQRAALVLREVYGFSCAEVAETLGISEAAAKMTLSRAATPSALATPARRSNHEPAAPTDAPPMRRWPDLRRSLCLARRNAADGRSGTHRGASHGLPSLPGAASRWLRPRYMPSERLSPMSGSGNPFRRQS
jgi:RNA polymerase sigma factor (sigma-70 family)